MTESVLSKLFEHNNWANLQLIEACSVLSDEQLDSRPQSGTDWTVRHTLMHLVEAQQGYLSLLSVPLEERADRPLAFGDLKRVASTSGEGLLALARDETRLRETNRLQTTDGYLAERWVVMLQAINHATEHRVQIRGMLKALGVASPTLDGWAYGEATDALVRRST